MQCLLTGWTTDIWHLVRWSLESDGLIGSGMLCACTMCTIFPLYESVSSAFAKWIGSLWGIAFDDDVIHGLSFVDVGLGWDIEVVVAQTVLAG